MTTTDNLNTNLSLNLVHKTKLPNMSVNTTAGLQYETYDWNSVFVHATGMIPTQTNGTKLVLKRFIMISGKDKDRGQFLQGEVTMNDDLYLAASVREMFLAQWAIQKRENGIQKWQPHIN